MSEGHRHPYEEVPTAQIWNNLSMKIVINVTYYNPQNKIKIDESILTYINGRKGKTLPCTRMRNNKYKKFKKKNDHLVTIIVITDSGKDHHWILKPVNESLI